MEDAAGLCVACGLCCDGTLFNRAKTSPAEAPRVRSFGVEVYASETHFVLPCPRLDGTACTIYAERFTVCRTFRCALLKKVESGEVDRSRADALVAEAKRLRGAATARYSAAGNATARGQRILETADWASRADPVDRAGAAQTYLALAALERFVQNHFRLPPKSALAPDAASGEAGQKGAA